MHSQSQRTSSTDNVEGEVQNMVTNNQMSQPQFGRKTTNTGSRELDRAQGHMKRKSNTKGLQQWVQCLRPTPL